MATKFGDSSQFMEIEGNHLRIWHNRSLIVLGRDESDVTVNLCDITSIAYRPPTLLSLGYIEIKCAGNNYTFSESEIHKNPYLVTISGKKEQQEALAFKTLLDQKVTEAKRKRSESNHYGTSEADELIKFKRLMDEGVISKAEFERKKKQILGV